MAGPVAVLSRTPKLPFSQGDRAVHFALRVAMQFRIFKMEVFNPKGRSRGAGMPFSVAVKWPNSLFFPQPDTGALEGDISLSLATPEWRIPAKYEVGRRS